MPNSIVKTITADGTTYDLQDTRISDSDISNWNSSGSGTITKVKTTAGAHTTIDVSSGAAQFNVPTKTSHLTNDSGFVTSDTKNTAGSTNTTNKIYLIGATEQSANPQTYSNSGLYYDGSNGFYSKSVLNNSSYSSIEQNTYGTQIQGYKNDTSLSGISVDSGGILLANKSENASYNSQISMYQGDISIFTQEEGKNVTIKNLVTPTADTDAATKKYVDDSIPTVPSSVMSATTGISIADHATTSITGVSGSSSIYGVQSTTTAVRGVKTGTNSTTTASKASGANGTAPTLGTAISITGVQSSTTTASKASGANSTIPSLSMQMDTTDTKQLNITFNQGTASTWSFSDITVPIKNTSATSIPNVTDVGSASTWSFTDVTVPIRADADTTVPVKNASSTTVPAAAASATTVVTGKTHSITDNGHTHTLQ